MIRKILIALVSSVIFCLSLAFLNYTPENDREPNVHYFSFASLVMIYLLYATPVYLLLGVPISLVIDIVKRKIRISNSIFKYVFEVVVYLISGILAIFLTLIVLSGGKILLDITDARRLFQLGAIASLLYYHIYIMSFLLKGKKSI
ncbi:hypothetical protein E8L90_13250 [Brevibacillus antibioticus]|uniref:Uncharacterized protein n=1 Tax=Brevibacillus antibioticus TaxID=2570228 RepID=A0A4U2Y6V1_9BACL|nr:hypothetical protein [Brevibacillus antibioticus]TKI56350.1 hypothetical protein E8L90_13250 [Brevibacillus antibioticus]